MKCITALVHMTSLSGVLVTSDSSGQGGAAVSLLPTVQVEQSVQAMRDTEQSGKSELSLDERLCYKNKWSRRQNLWCQLR